MESMEFHNQCPNCLTMDLQANPVSESQQEFELYLTCKFEQQQENLGDGKIKFGLRGGELKLSLKNAIFSQINLDITKNSLFQKINNVTESEATWIIRAEPPKTILDKYYEGIKLGIVKLDSEPNQIKATFCVKPVDINLTDIEGLWRHNISPNKHGILERKLAYFLYETKLTPYVSESILEWSDVFSEITLSHSKEEIINQKTLELINIIKTVYEINTNDLLELAKLARLNPLNDFAGGNFVGGDFKGINLSGANLEYINFRGTDLTDADLSEANLSYAKLNGADLSGAYLENINLQQANLHSASLALANLIGADLTGANLTETNLTNASLTNTKVRDTIFANNVGLTKENQSYLKEKGALFSTSET